jgi:uncharacterized integral membrane protein
VADPHHVAELTAFDRLTVRLYRAGLALTAAGLLGAGAALALGGPVGWGWAAVWLGAQLAVGNVHVYDGRFGWAFRTLGALGSAGLLVGLAWPSDVAFAAGLGFCYAALSGLGLKERLCFKVVGMRVMPVVLAVSLVPLLLNSELVAGVLVGLGGVLAAGLAWVKVRQPLHFDVGDKSKYSP